MTIAPDQQVDSQEFAIEDMSTGVFASGFGQVGDGRSFSFHVERQHLFVEVYRPRVTDVVPQVEDVVATASRKLVDIDVSDERSLAAAIRDTVASAR